MKQTPQCFSTHSVILLILLLINCFPSSLSLFLSEDSSTESPDSQPALIPTYDRSSSTTDHVVEPLKSNMYSETFEHLTTTTPLIHSDPANSTISTEYSSSTKPETDSHSYQSSVLNDSEAHESALKNEASSTFQAELKGDHLKPKDYIESIVNPEPYAKLLEFEEKEKPKEKPEVRVTIYHHQGFSDPVSNYGSGKPWNFYGTGYGVHYEQNKDGTYGREKGYQFEKAHGRDFCDKKECQESKAENKNYQTVAESNKTPVQSHVEGLLKHNNVDIQKWYREGKDYKPANSDGNTRMNQPTISTSIPNYYPSNSPPATLEPISFPSTNTERTPKPSFVTHRPPSKLHKISTYLTTPPPKPISATFHTPAPEMNTYSTTNYREPEVNSYSTIYRMPEVRYKQTMSILYPRNHPSYTTPVAYRPMDSMKVTKPNQISYESEAQQLPEDRNRYNNPDQSLRFLRRPHGYLKPVEHINYNHNDNLPSYPGNGNNYLNTGLQDSPVVHKPESHTTHYKFPQKYSSNNDFFSMDQKFWPDSLPRTEPEFTGNYNHNLNISPYIRSSSFMPRHTTPIYLPQSTNRVPFRMERIFGQNMIGMNPYS